MSVAPRMIEPNGGQLSQMPAPQNPVPSVSSRDKCERSNSASQRKHAPQATNFNGLEASGIPVHCPLVPDMIDPSCPKPPHASTENEDDVEDIFKLYTTLFDQPDQPTEQPEVGSFNALDASKTDHRHVSVALEPCAGEHYTGNQVNGAGSVEVPRPREERQRRKKAKAERRKSASERRTNPRFRYYCIIPTCKCSLERGWGGFPVQDDVTRHLATHESKKYICTLPHANGDKFQCHREDNMKK